MLLAVQITETYQAKLVLFSQSAPVLMKRDFVTILQR